MDNNGKSKGYGFVEFDLQSDFKRAYSDSHLRKLVGREMIVDCEYGRTNKHFRPTRLGGGLGKSRRSKNLPFKRY
mgnify:CR=1 FL=1